MLYLAYDPGPCMGLKPEKDRMQLSFLNDDEFEYFYFVTNTELPSEKVVIAYEKRGNAENYIKEAKYDMAVGRLLLKSFWANEAIFQLMMLTYNLFLLFKMDFANGTEYRQQIKTFRLKYIFLAGKIIRTARSVIMKLSEKYPYREMYEQSFAYKDPKSRLTPLFVFKSGLEKPIPTPDFMEQIAKNEPKWRQ